ncbi:hypothetical protein BGZ80_003190 [Entomortierella chlamydospora]|uniref:LYC1 C-terminal domain-containing protein n=1 Tax=Entomortierella chlamydospora TaxID=101097 RepID=A0A9P6T333_9FUNG|nr:hypothetical protein BGZ79_005427 [Entomortierella chlamydospora]KAG0021028.1 hypothetical protein BGZ80_003190 [Entomortierella chlamydospora]
MIDTNPIPTKESELELELIRATNPKVIKQVWLNNRTHFAKEMPVDVWLEKAALRTSLDLGPGIEHKTWILVPKGKGDDPSAILSAVHTYERPGFMSTATIAPGTDIRYGGLEKGSVGKTTRPDVEIMDVVIVYILLVFTPVEHRKQGYATKMLKMLRNQLELQTNPTVSASFLYSSVGPTFYEASGWSAVRSRELVMDVPGHAFPDLPPGSGARRYQLEDITDVNLQQVMDKDIELLRLDMKTKTQSALANQQYVAFLPEARIFQGQRAIASFTNQRVSHLSKPISRIGVRLVCDEKFKNEQPFIIWTYLVPHKLLLILRTRYVTVQQLQILLKEAMKEACEWDMTTMSLWDLNEEDALQAAGAPNRDRTVAWSCLGQFGGTMQPNIELLLNEAYIWGL